MTKKDAYWIIKKELSSGPKTSEELREACKRVGIVDSTYYYHLKQIVEKLHEAEEISEKDNKGRLVKKYALIEKREQKPVDNVSQYRGYGIVRELKAGDLEHTSSRALLELAAWIKHDPTEWDNDDVNVRKARLCLEYCQYLIPEVGETREDPDRYAFVWPDDVLGRICLEDISSRFFNFKSVYASVSDLAGDAPTSGLIFLGAYSSPVVVSYRACIQSDHIMGRDEAYSVIEKPQSVCVAVCREADILRVVHVETCEGKLDKAWVSGISRHLKAKKTRVLDYDSLKEDDRRDLLLNLRGVFEKRQLQISGRYTPLIKDLLEYSYKKPSNGYVLALALAVALSSKN